MDVKFNFNPASSLIDLYKYSFIDRIFIRLQTRALGNKFDRLFILLPAIINLNNINQQIALERTKQYLLENYTPKNLALKIYDRVVLRLLEYKKDKDLYQLDRKRAFDILAQNIQLLQLVDTILDDSIIEQKENVKNIVRKMYDENYKIDSKTKNLLQFQESHYI